MESIINNPLQFLYLLIHIACFWIGNKIATQTNFFSHNRNCVSHIGYSLFMFLILLSITFSIGIYPGIFYSDELSSIVAKDYKEKWYFTTIIGFIGFILSYLFTLTTARLGISKPYEPEGSWVYGDICLKSMRNAIRDYKGNKQALSHLIHTLGNNYNLISKDLVSKKWKQTLKAKTEAMRSIDNDDFERGRKGFSERELNQINALIDAIDASLIPVETKLKRCFERRKHKPGQWYR
jgi:hypothetical protein